MPITSVKEISKHKIEELPSSGKRWIKKYFDFIVNPPSSFIEKEKMHVLRVEEEGKSHKILVGLRIPENLLDDDEFRSIKDFFDFTHWASRPQGYDACLADSAEGLYFNFVVFLWMLDQFPDERFSQDYRKMLFQFLKLLFIDKDTRYYHKTPEGDLQICWNHIDSFLPGNAEHTLLQLENKPVRETSCSVDCITAKIQVPASRHSIVYNQGCHHGFHHLPHHIHIHCFREMQ